MKIVVFTFCSRSTSVGPATKQVEGSWLLQLRLPRQIHVPIVLYDQIEKNYAPLEGEIQAGAAVALHQPNSLLLHYVKVELCISIVMCFYSLHCIKRFHVGKPNVSENTFQLTIVCLLYCRYLANCEVYLFTILQKKNNSCHNSCFEPIRWA